MKTATLDVSGMADGWRSRVRYGEAFWRVHHEAWRQSDLNPREYCEAQGLSLKPFGNWRAKFKAEPQPLPRKLLYRRGGLSRSPSHTLSHMTYGSPEQTLIIPPARDGHRRRFSQADKRHIVEQVVQPGASLSEVDGLAESRKHPRDDRQRIDLRWSPPGLYCGHEVSISVMVTKCTRCASSRSLGT
jgi:hypothetical protein